jgi:pyrroloquinoline quinone biosynthesis protein B
MRVRILGSAAGGGVPQWNCRCSNCAAARAGSPDVRPRTQSSVAVSADGRVWFLLNVSPDVRQQMLAFPELGPPDNLQRGTAVAGCVLTDAELDHVAGLLLLREGPPFEILCTRTVRHWLNHSFPVEPILARFATPSWRELPCGAIIELRVPDGTASGLEVVAYDLSSHAPRYALEAPATQLGLTVGLSVRDTHTDASLFYAPGISSIGPELRAGAGGADCVLIDGTFWNNNEPIRCGIGSRSACAMGHLPVSGVDGSLDWLSGLKARYRAYVHVNNTNPMLNERGPEARLVRESGVRVGADGDAFDL